LLTLKLGHITPKVGDVTLKVGHFTPQVAEWGAAAALMWELNARGLLVILPGVPRLEEVQTLIVSNPKLGFRVACSVAAAPTDLNPKRF
jgi:hypothetical protein